MTHVARDFARRLAAATGLSLGLLLTVPGPTALAQQPSITKGDSVTGVVTVKSVDMATRRLVVTTAAGEDIAMKAPPEIQRLGEIKPGDKIRATYTAEVELVLSQPNQPLPQDAQTVVAARVAKGELPAGAVANQIVVTGAVIGIDKDAHSLRIVSPNGGQVHTVAVRTAEGRQAMQTLKLGDKITAYITESLVIAAEPA